MKKFPRVHGHSFCLSLKIGGVININIEKDCNIFEQGWDATNTYIFGLIMSDGNLSKQGRNKNRNIIRIGLNDYDLIQELHSYIKLNHKIYTQKNQHTLYYHNEDAVLFMKENELQENKSITLRYPINIPSEFMGQFIRGFFDGDGSVIFTKNKYNTYVQVSFTCGSYGFLEVLKQILKDTYDINSQIYDDGRKNNDSFYLKITRNSDVRRFRDCIYNNKTIYLQRKYDKFLLLDSMQLKYNVS